MESAGRRICLVSAFLLSICAYLAASETTERLRVFPVVKHGDSVWYEKDFSSLEPYVAKHSVHELTLELHFEHGSTHSVNISANRVLVPKAYKVITQHSEPAYKSHSARWAACFFHHSSQENGAMTAAVSLCGDGLSGVVHTDSDRAYTITPTRDGAKLVHHAVRSGEEGGPRGTHTCGQQDHHILPAVEAEISKRRNSNRTRRGAPVLYGPGGSPMVVEMHVVVDTHYVRRYGPQLSRVEQRVLNTVNYASALYRPLNIYIALVSLEVWSQRNQIVIPARDVDSHTLWEAFLVYRSSFINPRHPNDNAQLISGAPFTGTNLGKATVSGMCDYRHSGGVSTDKYSDFAHVAVTLSHEMGHNLGFSHDGADCQCGDSSCIMSSVLNGNSLASKWSSCSVSTLMEAINVNRIDVCLHNMPQRMATTNTICGNFFTEEGEECDCGPAESCANPCCDAVTCRLRPTAKCGAGECCDLTTCDFKPRSAVCRAPADEGVCDLPEFCSGETNACPTDAYKRDGTPCPSRGDYCYGGECQSRDSQCRTLYGPGSSSAPQVCYNGNTEGTFYGHCGSSWESKDKTNYVGCTNMADTPCGQLHCVTPLPYGQFAGMQPFVVSYGRIGRYDPVGRRQVQCRTAILALYWSSYHDYGSVASGAGCADGRYCVNRRCVPLPTVRPSPTVQPLPTTRPPVVTTVAVTTPRSNGRPMVTTPSVRPVTEPARPDEPTTPVPCDETRDCHGHGVCDNFGRCFCDTGFAAPDCMRWGTGGSTHSNPATVFVDDSLPLAIIITLSAVLPLLAALGVLLYCKRHSVASVCGWPLVTKPTSSPSETPAHLRSHDSSASSTWSSDHSSSVPVSHVNVTASHVNATASHVNAPASHVNATASHVNAPASHVNAPASHVNGAYEVDRLMKSRGAPSKPGSLPPLPPAAIQIMMGKSVSSASKGSGNGGPQPTRAAPSAPPQPTVAQEPSGAYSGPPPSYNHAVSVQPPALPPKPQPPVGLKPPTNSGPPSSHALPRTTSTTAEGPPKGRPILPPLSAKPKPVSTESKDSVIPHVPSPNGVSNNGKPPPPDGVSSNGKPPLNKPKPPPASAKPSLPSGVRGGETSAVRSPPPPPVKPKKLPDWPPKN